MMHEGDLFSDVGQSPVSPGFPCPRPGKPRLTNGSPRQSLKPAIGASAVQHGDFLALRNPCKDGAEIIVNLPEGDGFHARQDVPRSRQRQEWASALWSHPMPKTEVIRATGFRNHPGAARLNDERNSTDFSHFLP